MSYAEQQRGMFSSDSVEWETPQDFFNALDVEFDFTLDAAASSKNTKCRRYYTAEDDGLAQDWSMERVWINPPYGRGDLTGRWVRAAAQRMHNPVRRPEVVVMLVPARTDTQWFHEYVLGKAEIRFVRRRIKFVGAPYNAPFPCLVLVFRGLH